MSALLEVRAVSKRFGGLLAVSEVSFSLAEGEILGLIGPNGAGKTTLFNIVNGVYKADQGTIAFAGKDITRISPDKVVHRGLARTHQIVKPLNDLTLLDNVTVVPASAANTSISRPRARWLWKYCSRSDWETASTSWHARSPSPARSGWK